MKGIFKRPVIATILITEVFIYISFIYIDFTNMYNYMYSTMLKFSGILLNLILGLLIKNNGYCKIDTVLLQIALSFTVAADLCLLILGYEVLGVLLFCVVQSIYIIRHSGNSKRNIKVLIIVISIILIYLCRLDILLININTIDRKLFAIGNVYGCLLVSSLYCAYKVFDRKFYSSMGCYLICIGMTLFFLCDINVALSGLIVDTYIYGINLKNLSRFLVWIFYLPSQILLSLSGYRNLDRVRSK